MLRPVYTALAAFVLGGLGGAVFWMIGIPLPWLLGSIAASAIAASAGNHWPMPQQLRLMARPVVGVLGGAAFTPAVLTSLLFWWPGIILILLYSILISMVGFMIFTRLCKIDPVTAYFASAPGGLSELSLIGSEAGGDMKTLVVIHAIRVVAIVSLVPLILQYGLGLYIGAGVNIPSQGNIPPGPQDWIILFLCGGLGLWLGLRWRFPGSILVLSMIASATVHITGLTAASPPGFIIAFVQIFIGAISGARFAGLNLISLARMVTIACLWALIMILCAFVMAHALNLLLDIPFTTLLLAIVPGGTMEMITISYVLGAEVAFVTICHIVRLILVQAGAPLTYSLLKQRIGR